MNSLQFYISEFTKNKTLVRATAFCGGFGFGFYLASQKTTEIVIYPDGGEPNDVKVDEDDNPDDAVILHFQKRLDEIAAEEEVAAFDDNPVIDPPVNDPKDIRVDLDKLRHRDALIEEFGYTEGMRRYQKEYSLGMDTTPSEEAQIENVFGKDPKPWDQEAEKAARTNSEIYVLHKDEFWRDEMDYTQTTLTYYSGDDILVDQDEVPIYNYRNVVGELQFGYGSEDRNAFYVRNHILKAEYEILHDRGSYAIEVLGLEYEEQQERASLKHSLGKFRPDD
jgi:hypothetical protein